MLKVEVCYVSAKEQVLISLQVVVGTTVREAILRSSLLEKYPEIDLQRNKLGIFSKMVSLDTVLTDGDRIEIYRPLHLDPKQARQLRAKKQQAI